MDQAPSSAALSPLRRIPSSPEILFACARPCSVAADRALRPASSADLAGRGRAQIPAAARGLMPTRSAPISFMPVTTPCLEPATDRCPALPAARNKGSSPTHTTDSRIPHAFRSCLCASRSSPDGLVTTVRARYKLQAALPAQYSRGPAAGLRGSR